MDTHNNYKEQVLSKSLFLIGTYVGCPFYMFPFYMFYV